MRIPNPFLKTEYIIQEALGEGLTSQVYKAIRRHRRLHIEQTVAVKILNSKNQVRTLKNEIKILSQIRSAHCVQFLGWEDLSIGPAIVLEFLEGVSLAEFSLTLPLGSELVDEIVSQVQDGLRDLGENGICHGDLSARNIFITTDGIVKLLDFGFSRNSLEKVELAATHGTPQFLAPEIWLGQPISLASDLFSLGLIREDLHQGCVILDKNKDYWKQRSLDKIGKNSLLASDPHQRQFLPLESKKELRRDLSQWAKRAFEFKKIPKTQKLTSGGFPEQRCVRKKLPWMVCASLFLFFHQLAPAMQPILGPAKAKSESVTLDVRSHRWAVLTLYEKAQDGQLELKKRAYAPAIFRDLKTGRYEIHWKTTSKIGRVPITLSKNQRLLLH